MRQQELPGVGQREAAALLAEQRDAHAFLELAHLLADRRLRAPDAIRRAVEASELLGVDQRAQQVDVEIDGRHGSVFQNCLIRII